MTENQINTDIAVIGGGASGMCSAISAKMTDKNLKIVILEKLKRVGTKILSTGNGRCNLGNKNISEDFFHGSVKNFMEIISSIDTEDFFNSIGLLCRTDSEGRIYPYSNRASSVLDALRIRLANLDISEICGFDLKSVRKSKNGFILESNDMTVYARRVIIASGGYSSPSLGTDGAVTEIMKYLGHKITSVYPSLTSFNYKDTSEYKMLSGIRVKGKVTAESGHRVIGSEVGEIQFTSDSLSGICIFNLSHLVSKYRNIRIKIDFMPEKSFQEILDFLFYLKKIRKESNLEDYLTGIFAKNLCIYIIKKSVIKSLSSKVSELSSNEIKSIAGLIKSLYIEVVPSEKWSISQVTSGGIHGDSVNNDLESRILSGMYFSGEILDVDAICGGYNLMWAWASGLWAGKKCAENF